MSGSFGLAGAWLSAALLAAAPSDGPVDGSEAGREVTRVLAQDRYRFCAEDNEFSPMFDDLRWCAIAADDPVAHARCPGFAEVCARGLPDGDGEFKLGPGGSGGAQDKQPGEANRSAYEEREPWKLPDLGVFAQILMWGLLIGGVVALAIIIGKNLVRGRDEDEPEVDEADAREAIAVGPSAAQRAVETDVQRLLARAEQAAQRGAFEAAIADVYAALLRRLEGERLIQVERFKTNGDYLGELRPKPALRDEVRAIVREVEQVQFGAAQAEAGRYQSVRAKILAVLGRSALSLVALLTGATLLGCPVNPFDDPDALPDSGALAGLRTGPDDYRAVGELLLVHGVEARHRTRSIEQLASTDAAIVLLDDVALLDEDWDTLQAWIEDEGGTLIIATGEDFPRELGVSYQPAADEDLDGQLVAVGDGYYFDNLELTAPPGRTLSASGPRSETLVVREAGVRFDADMVPRASEDRAYVVRREIGEHGGRVIVFAEPDLLTNAGITVADNAALIVNLLRKHEIDEVEFVDMYTGAGADDPFESVANAKLGALFVQLLLFLALLYAAVGIPFARLREPTHARRRAFAEHVQTLGQRYAQARASRYVAGLYSGWALDRLRERVRVAGSSGLLPLAQAIAARTGRDEAAVMRVLVEAHELRDSYKDSTGSSAAGRAADLELMRQLAALLDEI